jgi:hypothetical protein
MSKKRASDVPLDQLDEKNTMRNEQDDDPRATEDEGRWDRRASQQQQQQQQQAHAARYRSPSPLRASLQIWAACGGWLRDQES